MRQRLSVRNRDISGGGRYTRASFSQSKESAHGQFVSAERRQAAISLLAATSVVGGVGAVAVAVPFVMSMTPSARARAAGAPVEVDISKVEPGMMITVEWRGQPVWIVHRTPEMLASISKLNGRGSPIPSPTAAACSRSTSATKRARSSRSTWCWSASAPTSGCSPTEKLQDRRRQRAGRRLAGRLLLPLPRFEVRPRGPRVQGRARPHQPRGSAVYLS